MKELLILLGCFAAGYFAITWLAPKLGLSGK